MDGNVLKVFDGVLQLLHFDQSQYVLFVIFRLLFHLMRDFLILKLRDDFQIFVAHLVSGVCLRHQIAFTKGNAPLKFMILNNLFGCVFFVLAILFFFFHFEMHSVMLVLHFHQVQVLILDHGKVIVPTKRSNFHHSSEILEALEDIAYVGKTVNYGILFDIEAILVDRMENKTNVAKITSSFKEIQRWFIVLIVYINFAFENEINTWADAVECYEAVLIRPIWF